MPPPAAPHRTRLAMGLALAAGFAVRLRGITAPPMDFHPTRQYYGALIARYYDVLTRHDVSDATRAVAQANCDNLVEPPVLQSLAVLTYHLTGGEHLAVPRALSALAWTLGAIPLAALARRFGARAGAWVAVALYLGAPYALVASRAFMPDPLMTSLLIAAVAALARALDAPTPANHRLAASAWGAAVFVKLIGVIFLPVMFVALCVDWRRRLRATPIAPWALAMTPAVAYYAYGYLVAGYLRHASQRRFVPSLLVDPAFWIAWAQRIATVIGPVTPLVTAAALIVGVRGPARRALAGFAVAYALFGVAFTYHVHTHDYYSLMLVPYCALTLGVAVESLRAPRLRAAAFAATALCAALGVLSAWRRIDDARRLDLRAPSREIARVVGPTTHALIAAPWYGLPHMFHGGFHAEFWPDDLARLDEHPAWTADDWLRRGYHGARFDWFILADTSQAERQPDLMRWLAAARVAYRTPTLVIYDLRR